MRGIHTQAEEFNFLQSRCDDFIASCAFFIPLSIVAGFHRPLAVAIAGFLYLFGTLEIPDDDFGQIKYLGVLAIIGSLLHFAAVLLIAR